MKWLLALLMVVGSTAVQARVDYAIDLTKPEHHLAQVSAWFPRTSAPYLDVKMAAWRTGRYSILNLANGVRDFAPVDGSGRPLRWHKVDKSTWRIHLPRPTPVRVTYELYGNELGLRSRHIDDSHAYLDASAVFLYADPYRGDDVAVTLHVPQGWRSVSGMESDGMNRFVAPSWDILVDSPIETGLHKAYRFSDGRRDYEAVFWGAGNYDAKRVVDDLRRIVPQARSIWSDYPFRRYLFIFHATDGASGATEHRNSTVVQVPRTMFEPRGNYLSFLSTSAHEFIHTWNVKAYRGAGLVPYDYEKENYSDLLWLAEGSTDYFADQFLLRAGIAQPEEYFALLADAIEHNRRTPGTRVQSVAQGSFDEWISVGGDRARNASISIYSEGSLVSWLLDIALLRETGGRVSFRDVHEALYRRYPAEAGRSFTSADVRAILRELTGTSWDAWWAANVDSPVGRVDFDALLSPVGLQAIDVGPTIAWAGWESRGDKDGARLTTVERESPAWDAGFTPGDVIVAIDGKTLRGRSLDSALAELQPGSSVAVDYIRRSEPGRKRLVLGSIAQGGVKVLPIRQPTEAQKSLFQRWLLVPFPAAS